MQKIVRKQAGGSKTERMRKLKASGENQGIRKKKPLTRNRSNFFIKFKKFTNLLPAEATHTTLDLFKKQPLLITFDNAFTQKVGPSYSSDGLMLEFEVLGNRNIFLDLQKLLLEIKNKISRNNDGNLGTGTDVANTDAQY